MHHLIIAAVLACCSVVPASAQVNVGIGVALPGISIGINFPAFPELVPVPGYPVYYAPRARSNYFFYDGMYWVYERDTWYASSWYNGPWWAVEVDAVPVYVLRVPVRYYRQPPPYFREWRPDRPPRWDERWGNNWSQRHRGWDKWDRKSAPRPAPLPRFQRQYSGNRYPSIEEQPAIHSRNYRYEPRDPVVQQQYQSQRRQVPPRPDRSDAQQDRGREDKDDKDKGRRDDAPGRDRDRNK